MRDRDAKFTAQFDDVMKGEGIDVVRVGPRAPNMNAHMERFMLTLQDECLNQFIVFGESHLRFLANELLRFYHEPVSLSDCCRSVSAGSKSSEFGRARLLPNREPIW